MSIQNLHFAAFMGDLQTVKEILKAAAPPTTLDTPPYDNNNINLRINNSELHPTEIPSSSKNLFNAHIASHVDEYGCTAVHEAARSGHREIIELLITLGGCDANAQCDSQRTPLHEACKFGHLGVAKQLIDEHGANPMTKDERGRDALHYGAANGRFEVVEYLLSLFRLPFADKAIMSHLPLDRRGNTPLHLAAARGHLEVVKALLTHEKLADPYFCYPGCEARLQVTPIHMAAANGHTATLQHLLGSAIETAKGSLSAISASSEIKLDLSILNESTISHLLGLKDSLGRTSYFMAACGDWEESMQYLSYLGADTNTTNNKGRCANA